MESLQLTASPFRAAGPAGSRWPGTALALLVALQGLVTTLAWILRLPALLELRHGLLPMVFNTGLCFLLAGTALALPAWRMARPPLVGRTRTLLALVIILLPGLTLGELLLDRALLGIDLAGLHRWYDYGNSRPGRMAPNTALGFVCAGCTLLVGDRVSSRRAAVATFVLTFALLVIGLTGLAGYALAPEMLFNWAKSARMAVPTALGMVGLAVSLWLYWSHSAWYVNESYFQEDGKVRLLSGAILIIVTTTASLTSFVLQQESERSALAERLNSSVRARGPWLQLVVREMRPRVERTALLAVLSSAERQSLQSGAALPAPSPELRTLAQDFAAQGWHRVQVQSASGTAAMALLGSARSQPTFRAPLDATGAVELLWDGALLLRFTQPLLGEAGGKGLRLVMERDATELASVVFSLAGLGQTGEITACVMQDGMLLCLPSRWQPQPFRVQPRPAGSPPLAMQLAVANQRGVREGLDYRQNNVIAAYGQLAPGLGFVIKQDAVEIFAPIRRALGIGVLMTLVVVLGGTAVMAWQLGPLVARMRRAEVLASETAQKMQTLAQYDVLTSLPNRALFMDRLASACLRAARSGEAIAVVFIDVDGFKGINDSLGHAAGDAMLVQTGQRLAGAVRKSDTVARLGGDEFTILLEGMSQAEHDVQAIMDSITRAMHPPLDLLGQQRSVTLSIGVALHPGGSHPVDAGELLTHADQAMYDAKRSGKNTHRLVVLAPPAAEMA